jgi:homoserine O-acetyltransferase
MRWFGRVAYERYGQLNAAGDNCVLLPTYYAGTDKSYLPLIGPGLVLDPARWCIVIPNLLGGGVSDSPSNNADFEPASIAENVRLQRALLDALGVKQVALAYGWSMGAMQALAWAAMYPEMVKSVLAVCGTARCWPLNRVFLRGQRAVMPAGVKAFAAAYAAWAFSAEFYREGLWRNLGFASEVAFLAFWEADFCSYDARDLLAMLETWEGAELSAEELGRITARTIMMPCDTDAYFTVAEAKLEAACIQGAELRVLHSPYGHSAGAPGRYPAESARIEAAMRALLRS